MCIGAMSVVVPLIVLTRIALLPKVIYGTSKSSVGAVSSTSHHSYSDKRQGGITASCQHGWSNDANGTCFQRGTRPRGSIRTATIICSLDL